MAKLVAPENFDFPFTPYDIQHDFMKNLYTVLEEGQLGIFESPTGTGKSLSIICGAIRWLKDHNKQIRDSLKTKIHQLEMKKSQSESNNSNDWFNAQAAEIQIVHQINELRLKKIEIDKYDEKIDKLLSKTKKTKGNQFKQKKNDSIAEDIQNVDEKEVEDEDILLEEESEPPEYEDSDEENDSEFRPTKIYICSRTHSQLSQFVGEIIKSPFGKNIRVASLASRMNYCINPDVTCLKNASLINERCLDMQKSKNQSDPDGKIVKKRKGNANCTKCLYFKQNLIEHLRNDVLAQVQDVEDLVASGKDMKACPYYASRLAAEDAELILVPYNTILHKATREANGITLKGNVIIIDEAHNLLEAMGQMHKCELTSSQMQMSLKQLKCYKNRFNTRFSSVNLLMINQLIFVLENLSKLLDNSEERVYTLEDFINTAEIGNHNMFKITKFCKEAKLAQKLRGYAMKYPLDEVKPEKRTKSGVKDFLKSIENSSKSEQDVAIVPEPVKNTSTTPILSVISFLESLTYSYRDGRIFVLKSPNDGNDTKFQFLLLNPSTNFEDIVTESRAVVVAGGTMKPLFEFKQRLFLNAGADPERIVDFSCDHIIQPDRILPLIITKGPRDEPLLFNYEKRMTMGNSLKSIILEACRLVKGGIVVFFPSYSYENWVASQIKDLNLNRPLFREPQKSGSVEVVLKKYSDCIYGKSKSGALLFSVIGGKLSEGLNFNDDLGRCIIVVGLPYANIKAPDLKEKMSYLDRNEGPGSGQKFYENLCMKAVNQSIGRAVRHKDDFATILLLDERFDKNNIKNALPGWIKRSLKVCDFEQAFVNVEKFFKIKY